MLVLGNDNINGTIMNNVIYTLGVIIVSIIQVSNFGAYPQDQTVSLLKGNYLGQDLPGSVPKLFAPGIISISGSNEYVCSIHPNMDLIVWTSSRESGKVINQKYKRLFYMKRTNNTWSLPEQLLLSKEYSEEEGIFSCDGTRLYYSSNRPNRDDTDLWYAEISDDGWKQAKNLEIPHMPEGRQIYVTTTNNGTLYFNSRKTKGENQEYRVYRSRKINGEYAKPEFIIEGSHPYVHPEEEYILLNANVPDGYGNIFICFRLKDGNFSKPINLGNKINTEFVESCPTLSPDLKYIFFSRYNEPEENSNIYWVSSQIIEKIKNKYMGIYVDKMPNQALNADF
jgi:hypothetical protein